MTNGRRLRIMEKKEVEAVTVKRVLRVVLPIGVALCTLFIWSQSLLSAQASTMVSETIKNEVAWMWTATAPVQVGGTIISFSYVIRKLAHLAEFGVLGLLWGGTTRVYDRRWLWLWGLSTGAIDECLQFLAPGRAPMAADVVLDTAGYLCGAALLLSVTHLWKKKKK